MSNQRLSRDRARKCLLTALALALLAGLGLAPVVHAQAGLWTQTLQEHFAAALLLDNVDVNSSPGDVLLAFLSELTEESEDSADEDAVDSEGAEPGGGSDSAEISPTSE